MNRHYFFGGYGGKGRGNSHFLPFEKDKFIETSVLREGSNWVDRFEKALDRATSVHYVTNEGYYGDDTLFSFCNDVMLGFAAMRGRGLHEDPHLLLFWDGNPGEEGGTGDVAESWRKTFNETMVICANEVLEELDKLEPAPIKAEPTMPSFKQSFGILSLPCARLRPCFLQMWRDSPMFMRT